jgi:hypothetical protein
MRRVLGCAVAVALAVTMTGRAQTTPLLNPGGLVWGGAFRLPAGPLGNSTFAYGGWALAYNAAADSLYVVGHEYDNSVAEIAIPTPVKGTSLAQLPVATVRQNFADPTEGRLSQIGGYEKWIHGGLLVFGGRLIGAAYSYFDAAAGAVASHYTHSLTLSATGTVTGMHRVGTLNPGYYAGNMAVVPGAWRTALGGPAITGQCCLAIVSRTSLGPSAFAFDPARLGATNPTPAVPLLYYPEANPLQPWSASNTIQFNGTTELAGAFIPEGSRSLVFLGRHGSGPFCYRCGAPDPYCSGDVQAPPYHVQAWAYDLNDLAAVKSGQAQPWSPRPYAIWELTGNTASSPLPFFTSCMRVRGLAYDAGQQRIFIASQKADGEYPVIHMFEVDMAVPVTPAAPSALRLIR